MAKSKTASTGAKVTFGKKGHKGTHKKKYGPGQKKPKAYRGQGR